MISLRFVFTSLVYLGASVSLLQFSPWPDYLAWGVGSAIFWLLGGALLGRFIWLHLLALPAFALLPAWVYTQFNFGTGLTPHFLATAIETSPLELVEFLGDYWWQVLLLPLAGGSLWWVIWREWRWAHGAYSAEGSPQLSWPLRFVSLMLAIALLLVGQTLTNTKKELPVFLQDVKSELDPTSRRFAVPFLAESWPFGVYVQFGLFARERYLFALNQAQRVGFKFNATQASHLPRTIVLVIGESTRAANWQLNGYGRETTPLLAQWQQRGLVNLSQMISPVSATRLSVPVMLTRQHATQIRSIDFNEKSIVSALSEAGYKTWWLSNQMVYGQFDTPITSYAKEADVVNFLNHGTYNGPSSYDHVLLSPLEAALRDPAPYKFIVLHTLGSHWNYAYRYPPQFEIFKPTIARDNRSPRIAEKPAIVNSYDNTIRYTDWFLDQVLQRLNTRVSALMYASDHGQLLYDNGCQWALHGHRTDYELHVPAFVWTSSAFGRIWPEKSQQLQNNADQRTNTEVIFPTLLDLAGVQVRAPQTPPQRDSLLSPDFKRHPRMIDAKPWLDYDRAQISGQCREIKATSSPPPAAANEAVSTQGSTDKAVPAATQKTPPAPAKQTASTKQVVPTKQTASTKQTARVKQAAP